MKPRNFALAAGITGMAIAVSSFALAQSQLLNTGTVTQRTFAIPATGIPANLVPMIVYVPAQSMHSAEPDQAASKPPAHKVKAIAQGKNPTKCLIGSVSALTQDASDCQRVGGKLADKNANFASGMHNYK